MSVQTSSQQSPDPLLLQWHSPLAPGLDSIKHGNSPCTITGVYANFHHLPIVLMPGWEERELSWSIPGALAATAPQCLTALHESVLTPPLLAEGKAFPAAFRHSDKHLVLHLQRCWGCAALQLELKCPYTWGFLQFNYITPNPLNKLIQLFLYRQDFNLSN